MVTALLLTGDKLSTFPQLRQAKECDLSFPTGGNKPKASLVSEKCDIGDFLLYIQRFICDLIEKDSPTVNVMHLNDSALKCH
jgi:hypothetical protein